MRAALAPLAPADRRHHMAWLGGDHSITLPLLRAYKAWLGRPLAVIHFDAHCDTWTDHFGEPSGHGTWVYEAMQEGLVLECFTQIGIRSAGERAGARLRARPRRRRSSPRATCAGWSHRRQLAPVAGGHPPAPGPAWPCRRSTSAWTSTAWTRPLRPAPARRSPAA
jgi:agmatinase